MENDSGVWKKFLRKHIAVSVLFVVAAILAAVGAVCVFLWFVRTAQSTGLVPSSLGLWTMSHIVTFVLYAIFWELLLIGVPVAVAAGIGWLWWRRIRAEEKMEYRFFRGRSRATGGGGAASILFSIAFCIKVFLDGNWNVAIASWTLDYVVYSMLWILIWTVAIFGIPAAIAVIWWIRHEMKKKPENPP